MFTMDLNNFKNSSFFKRGQIIIRNNRETNEWFVSSPINWFQANVNLGNDNIINRLRDLELGDIDNIRFDFHYLLTISKFDKEIKKLLLDQYFEVKKIVESMSELPYYTFLIIMPPNTYIAKHQHHQYTKHTLSYMYTVECTEEGSYVEVEDKTYQIPIIGNKFLLSMYNNPMHGCNNKSGWSFIWMNDYTSIIDIPNDVCTNFVLIN